MLTRSHLDKPPTKENITGLKSTDYPVFVTTKLSGLTDGKIPYHVNDSTGLADGPTKTDVDDAVNKKHAQQHAITSTSDHTSTATSGQILKADTNGLPVDATNTDADVASAVSLKHAAVTIDGTSPLSLSGQAISLKNDAAAAITEADTGTLANSDTVVPTSKAVKTYIGTVSDVVADLVDDGLTDNYAAIQAAIDAAVAAGGGRVCIPDGTFAISDSLKIDEGTGVSICGAGRSATIIKPTSGAGEITGIWLYKCTRCTVRDMTVQDFLAVGSGEVMGIHVEGGWYNTVTGCYVTNCDNSGIRIGYDRTAYAAYTDSTADTILKQDADSAANIAMDGGYHHVFDNMIYSITEGHGIEISRSNNALVHDNIIHTAVKYYGIRLVGSFDSIIHHNWIYDAYDMGIVISSSGETINLTDDDPDEGNISFITKNSRRCMVYANKIRCLTTMDTTSAGIYMTLGADGCKVRDNYIEVPAATSAGIHVTSSVVSYNTPWEYDFKNCEIVGNTIIGADSGILVTGHGSGLRIFGNTTINFKTRGIYLVAAASQTISGAIVEGNIVIPGVGASGTRYGIRTGNSTGGHTYATIGRNKFVIADIGDTFRPMIASNDSATDCRYLSQNVADYGAIGDGTTEDGVAVNYAVYAVNNTPVGELHFPKGTYIGTSPTFSAITNAYCRVTGYPPSGLTGGVARPDLNGTTSAADSLAIPITHCYVAKTTGADAEALTLADGKPGQILTISLVVDGGGDGTLTPTTKSGFVNIVFADAGDTACLMFTNSTTGWIILGTAGVAAPPAIALS